MTESVLSPTSKRSSAGPQLGFFDTVAIIVGIVVGTAIFSAPPLVFRNVDSPWQAVGVWLLGGVVSLFGAFCYAELATSYPRSGGDYHYLSRAYGAVVGFLFGWAQLCVVLTGSIGCMAFAFADYAVGLWAWQRSATVWVAIVTVIALSAVNLVGIAAGKWTQNLLTIAKIAGLMMIAMAGLIGGQQSPTIDTQLSGNGGFGLAMVFVLYAYGGWNDAAFVASEVRNGRRNIPLSLIVGVSLITAVYLAINGTYLWVLGFEGARETWTPAADVLGQVAGPWAAKAVSLLVMISALGAINGLILTGSRIFASMGDDHRVFSLLSGWNRRLGAPVGALAGQALIAVVLMIAVGTQSGQQAIDDTLTWYGLQPLPWHEYHGGFETLVAGTAPVFWIFFLLTGISVFILRLKDRGRDRAFVVPLFPLPPLVFCGACSFMLYASVVYAKGLCLIGLAPLALGLPIYWLGCRTRRVSTAADVGVSRSSSTYPKAS